MEPSGREGAGGGGGLVTQLCVHQQRDDGSSARTAAGDTVAANTTEPQPPAHAQSPHAPIGTAMPLVRTVNPNIATVKISSGSAEKEPTLVSCSSYRRKDYK
jgi:hypothetical protein